MKSKQLLGVLAVVVVLVCVGGCSLFGSRAATPEIFPPKGTYPAVGFTFRIESDTPGTEVRYTVDGSKPGADSLLYTQPVSLGASAVVRAVVTGADVRDSLGMVREYTLVDEGQSISGHLVFGDTPMSEVTTIEPTLFSFRDETADETITDAVSRYDSATGFFAVTNLPDGPVGVALRFHVTGLEPTLPGNYDGYYSVEIATLSDAEQNNLELGLSIVMHLTSPVDSNEITVSGVYPPHSSPVTFTWDAVAPATYYSYEVDEYVSPPSSAYVGQIVVDSIPGTTVDLALASLPADRHYRIAIEAYSADDELVGRYQRTFDGGWGWDYRFTVP